MKIDNSYLIKLRHNIHFSRGDVTFCSGINNASLLKLEHSQEPISLEMANRLAKFYNVSPLKLIKLNPKYRNIQKNSPAEKILQIMFNKNLDVTQVGENIYQNLIKLQKSTDEIKRPFAKRLIKRFNLNSRFFGKTIPVKSLSTQNFGFRLQKIMAKHQLNYKSLSHILDISPNYIRILTRKYTNDLSGNIINHIKNNFSKPECQYLLKHVYSHKHTAKPLSQQNFGYRLQKMMSKHQLSISIISKLLGINNKHAYRLTRKRNNYLSFPIIKKIKANFPKADCQYLLKSVHNKLDTLKHYHLTKYSFGYRLQKIMKKDNISIQKLSNILQIRNQYVRQLMHESNNRLSAGIINHLKSYFDKNDFKYLTKHIYNKRNTFTYYHLNKYSFGYRLQKVMNKYRLSINDLSHILKISYAYARSLTHKHGNRISLPNIKHLKAYFPKDDYNYLTKYTYYCNKQNTLKYYHLTKHSFGYRLQKIMAKCHLNVSDVSSILGIENSRVVTLTHKTNNQINKANRNKFKHYLSNSDYQYLMQPMIKAHKLALNQLRHRVQKRNQQLKQRKTTSSTENFFKVLRHASRLTQGQLAKKLGCQLDTIKTLEKFRKPRLDILYRLAKFYQIPLVDTLRQEPNYRHLEAGSPTYLVLKALLTKHVGEKPLELMAGNNHHRYSRQKSTDILSVKEAKRIVSALHLPKHYFDSVTPNSMGEYYFKLFLKKHPYLTSNDFGYRLKRVQCKYHMSNVKLAKRLDTSADCINHIDRADTKHTKFLSAILKLFPKEASYLAQPHKVWKEKWDSLHSPKARKEHIKDFLKKTHDGEDVDKVTFCHGVRLANQTGKRELCRKAGISKSTSYWLEKSKRPYLNYITAYRLSKFYHVPLIDFLRFVRGCKHLKTNSPTYRIIKFACVNNLPLNKARKLANKSNFEIEKAINKHNEISPKFLNSK